jgi:polysaccharide export outer membrane protein
MTTRLRTAALALSVATLGGGCASVGDFVWVDQLKPGVVHPEGEYVIAPGDVLSVRVFGQENMSGRIKVRTDGHISLPFINDHVAAGLTPAMLSRFLETQYKNYVVNPVVTVSVEEQHPVQVSVLGEVARPGVYRLDPGQGVLHALAQAGGLTQFAGKDRIFVVRKVKDQSDAAQRLRIRFRWQALAHADGLSASFMLQDTDVLVVE